MVTSSATPGRAERFKKVSGGGAFKIACRGFKMRLFALSVSLWIGMFRDVELSSAMVRANIAVLLRDFKKSQQVPNFLAESAFAIRRGF